MITSLSAGDEASGISLSPCLKGNSASCTVTPDIHIRIHHQLLKQIPAFQTPQLFYVYNSRYSVCLCENYNTVFSHKFNDFLPHLNEFPSPSHQGSVVVPSNDKIRQLLLWYLLRYRNEIFLVQFVIFIIVDHSKFVLRQPFHTERHGFHKAAAGINPDLPFSIPRFLVDIRPTYMVVFNNDGVCPLGRGIDITTCNKQRVTAALKQANHQEERRQSSDVLDPFNLHHPRPQPKN